MTVLDANLRDCTASFGRHETFHPRFAWLTRGVWAVVEDPFVFTNDDAPATLGVGKNMVHAIRYWCQAFGLTQDTVVQSKSSRLRGAALTPLAERIFGREKCHGADPYLENSATLWLLHSRLVRRHSIAPTWVAAVHLLDRPEFTPGDLVGAAAAYAEFLLGADAPSQMSLRRDVSCLLRMYGITDGVSRGEDPTESPFADLGLIRRRSDGTLAWDDSLKPGLPAELVAARAVEHMKEEGGHAKTMSVRRLLTEPWSPGIVFRLREPQLVELLQRVGERFPSVHLVETASLTQFVVEGDPVRLIDQLEAASLSRIARRARYGTRT